MAHLIDKDALVAEIEKLMYFANLEADIASTGECFDEKVAEAKYQLCKRIISIINTLEVKEVDLEKEIEKYCRKYYNCNYPGQIQSGKCSEVMPHIVEAARRFFELGIKVNNEKEK